MGITGSKALFLNFGSIQRALELYNRRVSQGMEGPAIRSFKVAVEFLQYLRESAVPEQLARECPNAPFVVDGARATDQFGLRREQIEMLMRAIIQGSGQVLP